MKTIKQMAAALGVDKQRVYRYIRKNRISETHQSNGVMYYDETAEMAITQHFSDVDHINESHHKSHQTASINTVIDILKMELDMKNAQIKDLNERLAETTAALVAAQQSAQAAQLLHAGTMQKQLTDGVGDSAEPDAPTRGFFARIFGRKNP